MLTEILVPGMDFRRIFRLYCGFLYGAMCPGSLRPGWRAPPCGGVFRVFGRNRGFSSVVERPAFAGRSGVQFP